MMSSMLQRIVTTGVCMIFCVLVPSNHLYAEELPGCTRFIHESVVSSTLKNARYALRGGDFEGAADLSNDLLEQVSCVANPVPGRWLAQAFYIRGVALAKSAGIEKSERDFQYALALFAVMIWDEKLLSRVGNEEIFDRFEAARVRVNEQLDWGSIRVVEWHNRVGVFLDGQPMLHGDTEALPALPGIHLVQFETAENCYVGQLYTIEQGEKIEVVSPPRTREMSVAPELLAETLFLTDPFVRLNRGVAGVRGGAQLNAGLAVLGLWGGYYPLRSSTVDDVNIKMHVESGDSLNAGLVRLGGLLGVKLPLPQERGSVLIAATGGWMYVPYLMGDAAWPEDSFARVLPQQEKTAARWSSQQSPDGIGRLVLVPGNGVFLGARIGHSFKFAKVGLRWGLEGGWTGISVTNAGEYELSQDRADSLAIAINLGIGEGM